MNKIAFITSDFLPRADANGVCVYHLAIELSKNNNVYVFCNRNINEKKYELIDGIQVYRVNSTLLNKFKVLVQEKPKSKIIKIIYYFVRFISEIKDILLIPMYPNVSLLRSHIVYKKFKKVNNEVKFNILIGSFKPYESIYTSFKVKKIFPDIKVITYYLDVLKGIPKPKFMSESLWKLKLNKLEVKEHNLVDGILLPDSSKNMNLYKEFINSNKIKYVDFPLFISKEINKVPIIKPDIVFDKEKINIVFTGLVDVVNRNPKYLLEVLSNIKIANKEIKVHFFGKPNRVMDDIKEYNIDKPGFVEVHGQVPYSDVEYYLKNANILINISNKVTPEMIPSKIFLMFSTGKPIINLINNKNDLSKVYFEKYPLAHFVNEDLKQDLEKDMELLERFIIENHLSQLSLHEIEESYYKNTPKYSVNVIRELIENKGK